MSPEDGFRLIITDAYHGSVKYGHLHVIEAAEHLWTPSSAWRTVHLPKYRLHILVT